MIFKIAWRNIWRNKRRSGIVLLSIISGLVAQILLDGLTNGMIRQMLFNQINLNIAHIQVHNKGYQEDKTVGNVIKDYQKVENALKNNPNVSQFSPRVLSQAMIYGKNNASGVMIYGVDPDKEKTVSIIENSIKEGNFLAQSAATGNPLVIGNKLATKLSVKTGDEVSVALKQKDGLMKTFKFRITGIFQSPNSQFNASVVYTALPVAQSLLQTNGTVHEFAVILKDFKKAIETQKVLSESLGSPYEVLTYRDILPLLVYQVDIYEQLMLFMNAIVDIALIFVIINTMLMAVFERIREIGILMAIGMKTRKIFSMIIVEAFTLGLVGAFIGLVLGMAIHIPLSYSGIDLALFSEGLESFGVGAIIYPSLSPDTIIDAVLLMPFVAVIAAIYPAYRATRLEPVESINYI